jgi:tRNA A37 threonylcarbamoyladenosine dehydratase
MEAAMTINIRRDDENELPPKLESEAMNSSDMNSDCMDSSGMWFAVAAVFALLAAGTIIYRVANDDVRMALSSPTAPVSNLR